MKKILCMVLLLLLAISQYNVSSAKKNAKSEDQKKEDKNAEKEVKKEPIVESNYIPILIGALLESPEKYLEKNIKFRGKFSSFSTLALDYDAAMRKSKDYISICLFRGDSKIPLSELKLAYPVKEAKEDPIIREIEEGDLLEIYGKVFSTALDEPWVDIVSIKRLEKANKESGDKLAEENTKKEEDKQTTQLKKSKKNELKQDKNKSKLKE